MKSLLGKLEGLLGVVRLVITSFGEGRRVGKLARIISIVAALLGLQCCAFYKLAFGKDWVKPDIEQFKKDGFKCTYEN